MHDWVAGPDGGYQYRIGNGPWTDVPDKGMAFPDTVENGKPVLHPSQDGTGCCEPDASNKILAALQSNAPTLSLSITTQHPALTTEAAQQLGITEEEFQAEKAKILNS